MPKLMLDSGEEFVIAPGGPRPRSLVNHVPEGATLHVGEDKVVRAIHKDGTVHHFKAPSSEALRWLHHPDYPERLRPSLARPRPSGSTSAPIKLGPQGTFVQASNAANDSQGTALSTLNFSGPVTAGNMLIVAVWFDGSPTGMTVTDSGGNTYSGAGPGIGSARIFYAPVTTGGSNFHVTLNTPQNNGYRRIVAHEAAGVNALAFVTVGSTVITSTPFDATVNTTKSGEYIFCVAYNTDGTAWNDAFTAGAGFTLPAAAVSSPGNSVVVAEYMQQASSGAVTGAFSRGAAARTLIQTAGFYLQVPDTIPPSVPTGLTATAVSTTQINLSWTSSTDNDSGVSGYKVYRGGTLIVSVAGPSYNDTGLAVNTTYTYTVSAYDVAGNVSAQSATVSAHTLAPDVTPPSAPTGVTATAAGTSQINLAWNASTDNVAVAGYGIYRGGSQVATSTSTSYNDVGLTPSTTYTYNICAYDAAGNTSVHSANVSATTTAAPVGSIPDLTVVSVGSTTVNLHWTPAANSSGTAIYRTRVTGSTPYSMRWEAGRVAYPYGDFTDGFAVTIRSGTTYAYEAAPYYNDGPLSAPVSATTSYVLTNGWQAWAYLYTSPTDTVTFFRSHWNVPGTPSYWATNPPQILYIFPFTEDMYPGEVTLLQPVLQWGWNGGFGGNYWGIASWYMLGGVLYHGTLLQLDPSVTELWGQILRTAPGSFSSTFDGYPDSTAIHVTGYLEQRQAGVSYEAYFYDGSGNFAQNPSTDTIFYVDQVNTVTTNNVAMNWILGYTNSGATATIYNNNTPNPYIVLHARTA